MTRYVRFCRKFGRARRGATAIEYAFLIGLVSIVILGAVTMLGESVGTLFGAVSSDVEAADQVSRAAKGGIEGNCGDGEGDGSAECDNK